MYYDGKIRSQHRVAYALAHGLDVETMGGVILHLCDNKACMNVAHLQLGTHQDNMDNRNTKMRQVHGVNVNTCKLTEEDVLFIRANYSRETSRSLRETYQINTGMLSKIILRHIWKHI